MSLAALRHVTIVDAETAELHTDQLIAFDRGVITAVASDPGTPVADGELDAQGRYALPGLIDCHVHALSVTRDLPSLLNGSFTYLGLAAGRLLTQTLERGFTTVRDCGGADWGIAQAVQEGVIAAPDVVYCGRAISQTGGQGDARGPGEQRPRDRSQPDISRVENGADSVREAVRDEARRGAGFVKLLAEVRAGTSWRAELSDHEVTAAVAEAEAWGIPVTAHAYSPARIRRLVELGVHGIEHANLLDAETAALMAAAGTSCVPTLGAYRSYAEAEGDRGIDADEQSWASAMVDAGVQAVAHAERAGVTLGFGTDLTVAHERQNEEFEVRAQVQSLPALIRSATSAAARILRLDDRGVLAAGHRADILLTRVNPLEDVTALSQPERTHAAVLRGGVLAVDRT